MSKKNSIVCMATGIASVVFGLNGWETFGICSVIGLACAIVSMIFKKKAIEEGAQNGFLKAGNICGIIGLVLSAIGLVGGIICGACACAAGGLGAILEGASQMGY